MALGAILHMHNLIVQWVFTRNELLFAKKLKP